MEIYVLFGWCTFFPFFLVSCFICKCFPSRIVRSFSHSTPKAHTLLHTSCWLYLYTCVRECVSWWWKKNNTNLLTVLVLGTLGLWLELECVCMCVVSSLSFASHIIHIRFDSMHQIPIAWHICNKVSNTQNLIYSQFYDSIITNYFITQLNRSSSTFVPTSKRNKRKEKWKLENIKRERRTKKTHTQIQKEWKKIDFSVEISF